MQSTNLPAKQKYVSIDEEVKEVLSNRIEIEGTHLRITGPRLERKLYEKVNRVLEQFGAKWKAGKVQAHVFPADPMEQIREAIGEGKVLDKKQSFQLFETPADLARKLVQLADLQPGNRSLEPSAGRGAILRAMKENQPLCRFHWVELDESHGEHLKAIHPTGHLGQDFLALTDADLGEFDRVVMNPPFSGGQDADHVQHAFTFLKSGGKLAAIVGEGICFRSDRKAKTFQAFLNEHAIHQEKLEAGAFKESGTLSNSRLIVLVKP